MTETRTAWVDKPQKGLRSGVVMLGKSGEPAMVLDYLQRRLPLTARGRHQDRATPKPTA